MGTSTLRLLRELLDAAQQSGPAVARRAGLTPTELASLEQLTRHPWGPGELARHLGVTSAAASGIVDRLVSRGHVERRPDEHDGRRTRVVLTDSGRAEVLGHLMPMFAEQLAKGTTLKDLVAAAALANARSFGGDDYIGFHAFMAMAPALAMSERMSERERALPVFKVLYRSCNRIQDHGGSRRRGGRVP